MQKRHQPSMIETLLLRLGMKTPARVTVAPPLRPFQAISVLHGTVCCASAKKISGYRFLAKKPPQLPLSECTMRKTCECRYVKHNDRRGDSRRLIDFGLKPVLFAAKERRAMNGRRAKDSRL
jgi:hypothetical protein